MPRAALALEEHLKTLRELENSSSEASDAASFGWMREGWEHYLKQIDRQLLLFFLLLLLLLNSLFFLLLLLLLNLLLYVCM
jgi:hypothetical protein